MSCQELLIYKTSSIDCNFEKSIGIDKSSLGDFDGNLGLVLDPASIVRGDVVPSWFELVTHSPHEVALDGPVEDVHDALTKAHDVVVSVEG